jgi:hypothetical protein
VEAVAEYGELDLVAFGDGSENSGPGVPRGEANIVTFLDPATDQSHDALKTPGGYTDKVFMALFGNNATPTIGDGAFALLAKEFQYTVPVAVKSAVIANAKFLGAGYKPDVNGVVLANTTITATTNFTSVDNAASSANGASGYLQVLTPTSTDTYVVKIQHSTDNNVWADLITFTLNGSVRGSERIAATGTVNRYVRAQATRTGAAADSFKLAVVIARN